MAFCITGNSQLIHDTILSPIGNQGNGIKTIMRHNFILTRLAKLRSLRSQSVSEGINQYEPVGTIKGSKNWSVSLENNLELSCKTECMQSSDSAIHLLGINFFIKFIKKECLNGIIKISRER